jgi:hypothetical protein
VAIAGLQSEFAAKILTNNELTDLLQGIVPKQIQARHPETNDPIFDQDGKPVYISDPLLKKRQIQRMVRLMTNAISKLKDDIEGAAVRDETRVLELMKDSCDLDLKMIHDQRLFEVR